MRAARPVRLFRSFLPALNAATPAPAAIDPTRHSLTLRAGERLAGLVISIAGGAASLRGRIAAATEDAALADQPLRVHLVPAEREQADNILRYAETATLADGSFSFKHLAPGRYFIVAHPADRENAGGSTAPRSLVWDAAARAALRREAESANVTLDLAPCQHLGDYLLRFPAK
ncbi:MAG: hypothetical protein LC747_03810 [Acidobacteria bacterium]|nr:hypothetical protein [Acidobacteriota bacterium]